MLRSVVQINKALPAHRLQLPPQLLQISVYDLINQKVTHDDDSSIASFTRFIPSFLFLPVLAHSSPLMPSHSTPRAKTSNLSSNMPFATPVNVSAAQQLATSMFPSNLATPSMMTPTPSMTGPPRQAPVAPSPSHLNPTTSIPGR
jgi:hypothetical protein